MKNSPDFTCGDKVEYKSGKRGLHYGLDKDIHYVVDRVESPIEGGSGEWEGWVVYLTSSNTPFPAGWFKRVSQ